MNFKNFVRKLGTGIRVGTQVAATVSQFTPLPAAVTTGLNMAAGAMAGAKKPEDKPTVEPFTKPSDSFMTDYPQCTHLHGNILNSIVPQLSREVACGEIDTSHELAVHIVLGLIPTLPPANLNAKDLVGMTSAIDQFLAWAHGIAVQEEEAQAKDQAQAQEEASK